MLGARRALRLSAWVLAAAGIVAAMPASSAAALQFHFGGPGTLDAVPMNLLAPPGDAPPPPRAGPGGLTFTCAPSGAPRQESEVVRGIAYAAPVVDGPDQSMRVEARGLAYATPLGSNASLDWYVEVAADTPAGPAPAVLANVVLRVAVREGEDVAASADDLDRGALLAEGQSPPALLAGPQSQRVMVHDVNGTTVYGFHVPLTVAPGATLTEAGFNVRIDLSLDNPACAAQPGRVAPPVLQVHSSPTLRPALTLMPEEPLRVGTVDVEESSAGFVHLRARLHSLWGPYAVTGGDVAVADARGVAWNATAAASVVVPQVAEPAYRATAPAYYLWSWNAPKDAAPAGTYSLRVQARSLDGNAAAAANVTLAESDVHPPSPDAASPSPAVAAGLLALGAAAWTQRKRR